MPWLPTVQGSVTGRRENFPCDSYRSLLSSTRRLSFGRLANGGPYSNVVCTEEIDRALPRLLWVVTVALSSCTEWRSAPRFRRLVAEFCTGRSGRLRPPPPGRASAQNTPGKSSSEGPPSPPSECRLTGKVSPRGPPNSPDGVPLRVIEFFSGIGGLRLGLEAALRTLTQGDSSLHPVEFVAAYDISTTANAVYAHNFSALPKCVSVEHLALQQVDGKADLWLLSPPCQPYTRGGKGLDSRDGRAVGLLHLLQLLRQCASPPRFLFLENVPGFESSVCCAELQQTLAMQHYTLEQFLLSPTQIGFPNTRVRFYCLARRGAAPLSAPMQQDFMEPSRQPEWRQHEGPLATEYTADFGPVGALPSVSLEVPPIANGAPRSSLALPIKEFLEEDIPEDEKPQLEVPPWRLARFREPTDGEESSGTEAARQENAGKDDGKGGPQKVENAVDRKAYSDAADKSFQAKREAQTEARNGEEQDQGRNGFRLELVTPSCTVKRAALVGNSVNVEVVAFLLQHLLQHLLHQEGGKQEQQQETQQSPRRSLRCGSRHRSASSALAREATAAHRSRRA
ncbi:DNA methyltransferase [Cyclospora cayetanensis]|uniref:DNA methyltransferase n=1 Tax=Cyclospora cayetanensis TaxID=88456 RepID=A0A1D3D838_9EIME|nr:DNA methyltransferase [Cyclospora cayetanensis]